MGDISEVVTEITAPKYPVGKSISIYSTSDHKVSFFTLGVEFQDADHVKLLDAPIEISPGMLQQIIQQTFDMAKAAADAAGTPQTIPDPEDAENEIANPDYPVKPNSEQMWTAAQNQLDAALEDENATSQPTLTTKLAAVANKIVTLLLSNPANPDGTYPQRWGKRMLKKAYYAKASHGV